MAKSKKIILLVLAVVFVAFAAAGFFYLNHLKKPSPQFLSGQEAAQKAIDYINNNMLKKGTTASLAGVKEENGLYKFQLKIGEKEFPSYVTKDGKILFPSAGIDLTKKPVTSQTKKLTCKDLKKSDNPVLEAFVVSKCPFGLQMQRILAEVVKNIPSLAKNIRVEYIGSVQGRKVVSMHGKKEAEENLRQICIREEQPDKFWSYIECHIKKGEVDSCLSKVGIDKAKLTSCMNDNSRGLKYAGMDFADTAKYKVGSSPAIIINGENYNTPQKGVEFDFGGRTAEALKNIVCCGFKTKPAVCSKKLTQDQAAVGLSEEYSGTGGSASCGK